MNKLSTQQILTIRKVLDKHRHHNVSIRSPLYQELENIIDILTDALVIR
jgi:hypothetical protein